MKKIAVLGLFWGLPLLAATNGYELKMNLSLNGKAVASPVVLVKEGQKATLSQNGLKNQETNVIEVVASEGEIQKHKGILLKFNIFTVTPQGEKKVVSDAQMLVNENETGSISAHSKQGVAPDFFLSVLAKRKKF